MKELFKGTVFHHRLGETINSFSYPIYAIRFDVTKEAELKSRLFSVNRWNLFSFFTKDHGYRDGSSLKAWAEDTLKAGGFTEPVDKIILHTLPRVLGYVFNPVSFWFCYKDGEHICTICEVNNTFGETHSYVVRDDAPEAKKVFHVSPFYSREGRYEFDFSSTTNVAIDYWKGNELLLKTGVRGSTMEMTDKKLWSLFIGNPVFTLWVIALIHWQAVKLFAKKVRFYRKPKQLDVTVT